MEVPGRHDAVVTEDGEHGPTRGRMAGDRAHHRQRPEDQSLLQTPKACQQGLQPVLWSGDLADIEPRREHTRLPREHHRTHAALGLPGGIGRGEGLVQGHRESRAQGVDGRPRETDLADRPMVDDLKHVRPPKRRS